MGRRWEFPSSLPLTFPRPPAPPSRLLRAGVWAPGERPRHEEAPHGLTTTRSTCPSQLPLPRSHRRSAGHATGHCGWSPWSALAGAQVCSSCKTGPLQPLASGTSALGQEGGSPSISDRLACLAVICAVPVGGGKQEHRLPPSPGAASPGGTLGVPPPPAPREEQGPVCTLPGDGQLKTLPAVRRGRCVLPCLARAGAGQRHPRRHR